MTIMWYVERRGRCARDWAVTGFVADSLRAEEPGGRKTNINVSDMSKLFDVKHQVRMINRVLIISFMLS